MTKETKLSQIKSLSMYSQKIFKKKGCEIKVNNFIQLCDNLQTKKSVNEAIPSYSFC